MKSNEKGTWDYFYTHASGQEKDAVSEARRLEWFGTNSEERRIVKLALTILKAYDLD